MDVKLSTYCNFFCCIFAVLHFVFCSFQFYVFPQSWILYIFLHSCSLYFCTAGCWAVSPPIVNLSRVKQTVKNSAATHSQVPQQGDPVCYTPLCVNSKSGKSIQMFNNAEAQVEKFNFEQNTPSIPLLHHGATSTSIWDFLIRMIGLWSDPMSSNLDWKLTMCHMASSFQMAQNYLTIPNL